MGIELDDEIQPLIIEEPRFFVKNNASGFYSSKPGQVIFCQKDDFIKVTDRRVWFSPIEDEI